MAFALDPGHIADPEPDGDTAPYWEAANQSLFGYQHCASCTGNIHPPAVGCPFCGSDSIEWRTSPLPVSGTVHSYVAIHRAFSKSWAGAVPYVVARVQLSEPDGIFMVAAVDGWRPEHARIGAPMALAWEPAASGQLIPVWRPAAN
jgi:uncharacterized OB-fold protein